MSHTATAAEDDSQVIQRLANDLKEASTPLFTPINPPTALNTCDRCGDAVEAVVTVRLPGGLELMFCGNHARKHFGYEHTRYSTPENKSKGTEN